MPRGGKRTGKPGTAYTNRTDLQVPMAAASGQQYGRKAEQMAAQRALPVARPSTDAVSVAPAPRVGGPGTPSPAPGLLPGQVVPLDAPTQRPNEPLTAGLPIGAGPGVEALGALGGGGEDVGTQLRAIYARFPNEELRSLLELIDD